MEGKKRKKKVSDEDSEPPQLASQVSTYICIYISASLRSSSIIYNSADTPSL